MQPEVSIPVPLGEWLPDQADLDNPGLVTATNVIPLSSGYGPYRPFQNRKLPLASQASKLLVVRDPGSGSTFEVAGTSTGVFYNPNSWTSILAGSSNNWDMAQYDAYLIICADGEATSSSAISSGGLAAGAAISGAPEAKTVNRIGNFVVLGALTGITEGLSAIQWSAIGDPTDWPVPATSDARTKQSGREYLDARYGEVKGIVSGEFYGYIFQESAITKVTYVGGDVVFQFEVIVRDVGLISKYAFSDIAGIIYFISDEGLFAIANNSLQRIGYGKVDQFFKDNRAVGTRNYVGANPSTGIVYFGFNDTFGQTSINRILIYNTLTQTWSLAEDDIFVITDGLDSDSSEALILGVGSTNNYGFFSAAPIKSTFVTSEGEINTGSRTMITGVKPNVTGSSRAVVRVGERHNLDELVNWTDYREPTQRTRRCDFRSNARYHRLQLDIYGDYGVAKNLEVYVKPVGRF